MCVHVCVYMLLLIENIIHFIVQSLSHVQFFVIPWTAVRQASPSITMSQSLFKLMSIESVMPSNHFILCPPLLLTVFSNESVLWISWPKYWTFSFSPSNEYSGLISYKNDWFNLLAIQGTLKSLLQHYSLKASVLCCSAFFIVQLSHPYMITGKTKALTIQVFVSKVISLIFNMLSRFIIAFLSRSKRLLISWLQSPSTVNLEPKKIKVCHCFHFSPSICNEMMRLDAMIFIFWMLSFFTLLFHPHQEAL